MLVKRMQHSTVSLGNKLFVIGGNWENDSEVFDSVTNKFVFIKNLPQFRHFDAMSFGHKIYVFGKVCENCQYYMWTYSYNDKLNVMIQENNEQVDCEEVKCAKMPKK